MKRLLYFFILALSLLLCIVTCVMWYAANRHAVIITHAHHQSQSSEKYSVRFLTVNFAPGRIALEFVKLRIEGRYAADFAHAFLNLPRMIPEGCHRDPPTSWGAIQFQDVSFWNKLGFALNRSRSSGQFAMGEGPIPPDMPWMSDDNTELSFPYWLIIILTIAPQTYDGVRRIKSRKRAGRCPSCGYDLRATPARCPECGLVPPTSLAAR
ncbi:MAG TPA: hypothetical protein VFE47_03940 [Tepidisphaeraceae bacterium]|jgi:hypothetical protein|nr:hypothetical protein [Tepidisphaeraceae bacterium]